jgi:CheY-like chemotaxis protein
MPDGGRLLIRTQAVRDEGQRPDAVPSRVAISVTDTGVGMDEATRARVFEPFFTTKDQGKGTGLGLSTAYGIVDQSGGWMRVSSELGVGSTFTISLAASNSIRSLPTERRRLSHPWDRPRNQAAVAVVRAVQKVVEEPPAPESGSTSRRPTILLAEDEPAVRSLVEHILRSAGFTVVAAVDGREALDIAEGMGSIDLLLTDVMMPRLNGPDLATALREQRPGQPVLFMSGFTDDILGERGIISPEVELLTKPFTPKELVARINQVLAATGVPPTAQPDVA